MKWEEHCNRSLNANFTRIRGGGILPPEQIEALPSITITTEQLDRVHLRYNPGYVDDGDIDWVEHLWALHHFKAVAFRLAYYTKEDGQFLSSVYRFYFENEEDAMRMKLES